MNGAPLDPRGNNGSLPQQLLVGFVAGFLAVLIFQQGLITLMHTVGMLPNAPFRMRPTWPIPCSATCSSSRPRYLSTTR